MLFLASPRRWAAPVMISSCATTRPLAVCVSPSMFMPEANNHAAPSAVKALGTSRIQPKRPKKRRKVEVLMPAILYAGERVDRRPQ